MRSSKHLAAALWRLCSMLLVLGLGFPTMADAQNVRMSVFPKRLSWDIPVNTPEMQSVLITNESKVSDINITDIAASPDVFSIAGPTDPSTECPVVSLAQPLVLHPGASCLVTVVFDPTTPGKVSGLLTFTDDASNEPQVKLIGNGF